MCITPGRSFWSWWGKGEKALKPAPFQVAAPGGVQRGLRGNHDSSAPPRIWGRRALLVDKPAVCQRNFPIACLRTASRASTASNRDGNVFFSANASICSRKIPEMTYTPSFLIIASFFRYFVNALSLSKSRWPGVAKEFCCFFAALSTALRNQPRALKTPR